MNDILFKVPSKQKNLKDQSQIEFYESKLNFEVDPADLAAALRQGEKIVVIDTRSAEGFETEHIPGAINIPHRTMREETTRHLDRGITYVTYCDGIGCNASTKGALNLARLGFKVKELIGGLEWWKADGYSTSGTRATGGNLVSCYC
jgi:rhodanese-related sulfurtransferase